MDQYPNRILVFLVGAIGSVAPEIVRLYGKRQRLRRRNFPTSYFLVSIAYMVLGGVTAVILPAVNYYAALYAGITMPVTISSLAKHSNGTVEFSNVKQEAPIQASEPSSLRRLKELIQDHADRLFY